MKHLKTLCIVAALMIGMVSVNAQSKVAHINTKELIGKIAIKHLYSHNGSLHHATQGYLNIIRRISKGIEANTMNGLIKI